MPKRNKLSVSETKLAISHSLGEWGIKPSKDGQHASFSRNITSQAVATTTKKNGPVVIDVKKMPKIPQDRDEAIKLIFCLDLQLYQDDEWYERRSNKEEDALENMLNKYDSATSILCRAPYYQANNNTFVGPKFIKKRSFTRFQESVLEPFRRFSIKNEGLSKAQLAYKDGSEEGRMNGYAFEAIVASHAVYFESCFQCKRRNTLHWCGGSSSSWRDLYCRSCHSCFEIKSKKERATIDRIFQYNELYGGSFSRLCEEDFPNRVEGSDFVVLVSRKPSYEKSNWVWMVEIAEIGSVSPILTVRSLVRARDERVPLKTAVTLKNRRPWFQIPTGTQPNLQELFRQAYEEVFPAAAASDATAPSRDREKHGD
jgi:hypothetical protein